MHETDTEMEPWGGEHNPWLQARTLESCLASGVSDADGRVNGVSRWSEEVTSPEWN